MKRFLTTVTLGLIATVVAVLATHLILIAVALVRANRNLAKLVGGLEAIRDNTAPLEADLGAINTAAVALRAGLLAVDGRLRDIVRLVRG